MRKTTKRMRKQCSTDTYHDVDGLLAGCADGYPAVGGPSPADALLLWVAVAARRLAVGGMEAARGVSEAGFGAAGRLGALRTFPGHGLRVGVGGLQVRNGFCSWRHAGYRAS